MNPKLHKVEMETIRAHLQSPMMQQVVVMLHTLSTLGHRTNMANGFWKGQDENDYEKFFLAMREISEAGEALRGGNPPDKNLPDFSAVEVEQADAILRILNHSRARGWRVPEAVLAKAIFNTTRPYKHGGKAC